ncbi:MAG TPA: hypothetical protein VIU13_14395 [Chryseolinea sp.]
MKIKKKWFNHAYYSDWKWLKSNPAQALHVEWLIIWVRNKIYTSKAEKEVLERFRGKDSVEENKEYYRLMDEIRSKPIEKLRRKALQKLELLQFGSVRWIIDHLLD